MSASRPSDAVVETVRATLEPIDPRAFTMQTDSDQYEQKISVEPVSPTHCGFWFAIGDYGTYDFGCGYNTRFEELPITDVHPQDFAAAALGGHVIEILRIAFRRPSAGRSRIKLLDGRKYYDSFNITLLGAFWPGGRKKLVTYAPYPRRAPESG